jgi:hypothetical protein
MKDHHFLTDSPNQLEMILEFQGFLVNLSAKSGYRRTMNRLWQSTRL